MLNITTQAADHIQRVRGERGLDDSSIARFIRREGRVKLTFAKAAESGDKVHRLDGLRVAVAPEVADTFTDTTVDARTKDGKTWLVVGPPRTAKQARTTGSPSS